MRAATCSSARTNGSTKAFAANLDQIIVMVASDPVFSESQLARALIAAASAGIGASILLNKADLPAIADARERLEPYTALRYAGDRTEPEGQPRRGAGPPDAAAGRPCQPGARSERHRQEHPDQPARCRRTGPGRRDLACAEFGPPHDHAHPVALDRSRCRQCADRLAGLPGIRPAPDRRPGTAAADARHRARTPLPAASTTAAISTSPVAACWRRWNAAS